MGRIFVAIFLFFSLFIQSCLPYNLESRLPLFKYGPSSAKFGFSVALHRTTIDDSVGERGTLMVAGAPTARYNPSRDFVLEGTVPTNPGGVFHCPVSTDPGDCTRVNMDEGGDVFDSVARINTSRSNQWLGASLKSQGPGKYLVTCAHRYRQVVRPGEEQREVERLCGKCFLLKTANASDGSSTLEEVPPDSPDLPSEFISDPCIMGNRSDGRYHKNQYGHCQAGISISLTPDQYVLGAPGTWAWTGAIFDFEFPNGDNVGENMFETPTCFGRDRTTNEFGQWRCSKMPIERDSYMGISVATSTAVNTDSDDLFYVAGAPRANHTGAVVFFKKGPNDGGRIVLSPEPSKIVYGEKIGSSFGYSIALTDLNADGLDDLIVGAPQYYEYTNKRKAGGAIYIYLNDPDKDFGGISPISVYGPSDSFFGHSVAAIGDIDQDGFNDFAVGAPYEGESGMVHIYRGGNDGPRESQVIKGSEFPFVKDDFQDIIGFGASLSGSVDADSNKYPDLMIGTLSDSAALLRSRPIITVDASFEVMATELDLEQKNCSFAGSRYTCFDMQFCLSYKARHANYPGGVDIKYNLTFDKLRTDGAKSPRLHYDSPTGPAIVTTGKVNLPRSDARVCPGNLHKIYFDNSAEDKLTDAQLVFEFDLDISEVKRERRSAPIFDMIRDPILDAESANKLSSTLIVKNSCGKDGCQSDLRLSGTISEEVIAGDDIILVVNVENRREEAHLADITVYLPPQVDFVEANITDPSLPGMNCYSAASGESSFIHCDLGNPYKSGMKDEIRIRLSTFRLDSQTRMIDVRVEGHTTSENVKIPPLALETRVIVELSLSLSGYPQPEQVRYKKTTILGESAMKTTEDIGPLITYTFTVENNGLQPANDIGVSIRLPIEIGNGKWLLYLVTSDVEGRGDLPAGTCNSTYINTLQLEPAVPVAASISSKRRAKRAAMTNPDKLIPEAEASTSGGGFVSKVDLACELNNVRCVTIQCDLDPIDPRTTASIVMQLHLWEATFLEEFKHVDLVYVSTKAKLVARDESVKFKNSITKAEVETTVDHETFKSDVNSAFPWWYILIGIIVLLIFYIVIIVLLVRCGFFTRKKYRKNNENEDEGNSDMVNEEKRREDDEL